MGLAAKEVPEVAAGAGVHRHRVAEASAQAPHGAASRSLADEGLWVPAHLEGLPHAETPRVGERLRLPDPGLLVQGRGPRPRRRHGTRREDLAALLPRAPSGACRSAPPCRGSADTRLLDDVQGSEAVGPPARSCGLGAAVVPRAALPQRALPSSARIIGDTAQVAELCQPSRLPPRAGSRAGVAGGLEASIPPPAASRALARPRRRVAGALAAQGASAAAYPEEESGFGVAGIVAWRGHKIGVVHTRRCGEPHPVGLAAEGRRRASRATEPRGVEGPVLLKGHFRPPTRPARSGGGHPVAAEYPRTPCPDRRGTAALRRLEDRRLAPGPCGALAAPPPEACGH
mmetsp:Transcript_60265/g.173902  ORF Transcript_60265/g.173902 Transcript_60265/m.173902 type:complete len:344 (+) Transcript_60265:1099-2130(+)